MTVEQVRCHRRLPVSAKVVWDVIKGFDLSWHPNVSSCQVLRDASGAVVREFDTDDGGSLVEQQTYRSDTDRVLCYMVVSGIDGLANYQARIEVAPIGPGASSVNWSAEISAIGDRRSQIASGTKLVFEAGLDALQEGIATRRPTRTSKSAKVSPNRDAIAGHPKLSVLSGPRHSEEVDTLVLFLHGIGGCADNWTGQIAALGSRFNAAALDLRGYGESALGSEQTRIEDYCADILSVADHLNAQSLVLVGLSMGSWIATSFAMRHPDRLRGLVLAGGCTGMSEADREERECFLKAREVPLNQGKTPADFANGVVRAIAGPSAGEAVRQALHHSMAAIPAETYRDALTCFCNPVERFDFAKITCPVFLLTGEHDKLASPSEIRGVSRRIWDARIQTTGRADVQFEVIPDAGHVCNLEQPDVFNARLEQFLNRLPHVAVDSKPSRLEKQREKRARILQAAHVEFCEAGFSGASMDRIASASDVSKPTLYQYFGDKEGLFAAVLEAGRDHIVAPLFSTQGTLVDRLWKFSWTYADFVLRPDMLSLARLILGEAGRRPDSAVRYHENGPGRAFQALVSFIETSVAAGELWVEDAELAANDLWSLILSGPRDHHLHHVDAVPNRKDLLRVIGHGLTVFLRVYATDSDRHIALLQEKIVAEGDHIA